MNHNSFIYGTALQQTYNYILEMICNGSNSRRTNTALFLQGIFHDIPYTINVKQKSHSTVSLCPSEHQRCTGRLKSYVLQAI